MLHIYQDEKNIVTHIYDDEADEWLDVGNDYETHDTASLSDCDTCGGSYESGVSSCGCVEEPDEDDDDR